MGPVQQAQKTFVIQLRKNPNFCLGIDSAVAGAKVTLHRLGMADPIPGRMAQKWDWVSSPPRILNQADEAYGIDNFNGVERMGNPVYLWHLGQDNDHQAWQMLLATAGKPE